MEDDIFSTQYLRDMFRSEEFAQQFVKHEKPPVKKHNITRELQQRLHNDLYGTVQYNARQPVQEKFAQLVDKVGPESLLTELKKEVLQKIFHMNEYDMLAMANPHEIRVMKKPLADFMRDGLYLSQKLFKLSQRYFKQIIDYTELLEGVLKATYEFVKPEDTQRLTALCQQLSQLKSTME